MHAEYPCDSVGERCVPAERPKRVKALNFWGENGEVLSSCISTLRVGPDFHPERSTVYGKMSSKLFTERLRIQLPIFG